MDQNVSKQKRSSKTNKFPQPKKVPLLGFLHHHSTPQGSTCHMDVSENSGTPKSSILIVFSIINHPFWGTPIFGNTPVFPWARTLICACMLAPARDGKFAKAAKVSWEPRKPSCLIMLVVKGRWQILCSWSCLCKTIQVKKIIHLFGAQKKSGWTIPNSVKCDCSPPAARTNPPELLHQSQPSPRKRGTSPHSLPTTSKVHRNHRGCRKIVP